MERTGIDSLLAYWNTVLDSVQVPPSLFYEMVEEEISLRQIPHLQIMRVFWREGGWFSARREYLRVRHQHLVFDICGFPISNSFAVSWWLGSIERNVKNLFFETPLIGGFLEEKLSPVTYFAIDSNTAYQRAIHNSVLRVVDELTEQNELPRLAGLERMPEMPEFYE